MGAFRLTNFQKVASNSNLKTKEDGLKVITRREDIDMKITKLKDAIVNQNKGQQMARLETHTDE